MRLSREERNRIIDEVRHEVYRDIYRLLSSGDTAKLKKHLENELKTFEEIKSIIIHRVDDDLVRCEAKNDNIICKVKQKDGSWKQLNETDIGKLHMMKYVSRDKESYGLDCKPLNNTIDCNYVSKSKLEKIEKPKLPEKISWTGVPGFNYVVCSADKNMLHCEGSPELVWGELENEIEEKNYVYNKKKDKWEEKITKKTITEDAIIGDISFDVDAKKISFTTATEPDLDGLTFIEMPDVTRKKGHLVVLGRQMKGKPYIKREWESLKWVRDEDAGRIGQGIGSKRRKTFYDIEDIYGNPLEE